MTLLVIDDKYGENSISSSTNLIFRRMTSTKLNFCYTRAGPDLDYILATSIHI